MVISPSLDRHFVRSVCIYCHVTRPFYKARPSWIKNVRDIGFGRYTFFVFSFNCSRVLSYYISPHHLFPFYSHLDDITTTTHTQPPAPTPYMSMPKLEYFGDDGYAGHDDNDDGYGHGGGGGGHHDYDYYYGKSGKGSKGGHYDDDYYYSKGSKGGWSHGHHDDGHSDGYGDSGYGSGYGDSGHHDDGHDDDYYYGKGSKGHYDDDYHGGKSGKGSKGGHHHDDGHDDGHSGYDTPDGYVRRRTQ